MKVVPKSLSSVVSSRSANYTSHNSADCSHCPADR